MNSQSQKKNDEIFSKVEDKKGGKRSCKTLYRRNKERIRKTAIHIQRQSITNTIIARNNCNPLNEVIGK